MSEHGTERPHVTLRQTARWLAADMETPISLFLGMVGDGHGILLESAEVDGRWGRYSVLATDMLCHCACRDGRLALDVMDERLEGLRDLDGLPLLEGLAALMGRLEILPPEDFQPLPPITRGLYGYFGFDMAGLFEPKLRPLMPTTEDACELVLPGTVMVFDHLYNRLCQVSLSGHRPLRSVHGVDADGRDAGTEGVPADADVAAAPGEDGYKEWVERIKFMLREGEAIQVVPSVRFSTPFAGDTFGLYRRMRRFNASPYMFYMRLPELRLFGSSPEVMVRCVRGNLLLAPIAGTRKRGEDDTEDAMLAAELRDDPKERAEHVMLVDLGRNDLGRIAQPGSVAVERYMEVERFSHVMHLTSRVTARLARGLGALDVLRATFPAGTVSGAPKVRAMEIIRELEGGSRGPYAGCIGWLGLDRDGVDLDTGITIRSMWERDGVLHWQAGGGIVHDSDPEMEWREVCNKSAIMRLALDTEADHVPGAR
ncbi:MAG: anthranilate synthase component I family protein [Desulfovibrio sp.]|jgi:anthranilate synthase component 1|nr:anthranilate synthase component I family protein [Desulfovibrio sp.]